jgi:hypothetical protein
MRRSRWRLTPRSWKNSEIGTENDRPYFISFHILFHRCYVRLCYIICTRIEVAPLLRSQT